MRAAIVHIAALSVTCSLLAGILLAEEPVQYERDIKPLLAARCYACHGALKQESGLRLDTAALAIQGGDSGAAVAPGDAAGSLMIQRVAAADAAERMPPEGEPLTAEQVVLLRQWIDARAPAPAAEQPEPDPRDHWAFRPIVRPPVPQVANAAWVRNPIDAFLAEQHALHGLTPQAEAAGEILVRRLCFDLIGLPPEDAELQQVNPNTAADGWYEPLVERLLDDPRHGERWARHWMDIWRYSDWWGLGDQLRNSQPHIWHWRDWIVDSLNANVPYDEMVRLMLAADESHPNDLDRLRASGFLARNYFLFNRNQWLEETVEHVSKAFLGLTINCAKCHEHKYDPLEQVDFYRMRAFFEPYHVRMDVVPGESDLARDGIPRAFDGQLDAPTYRFERGQESQPDKSQTIAPGIPAVLEFEKLIIQPVALPKESQQPSRRPWVIESHRAAAKKELQRADESLTAARGRVETAKQQLAALSAAAAGESAKKESSESAVRDAEAELHVAELAAAAARSELASVESRAAATRATWTREDDPTANPVLAEREQAAAFDAVRAERRAAVTKATRTLAAAELKLGRADADSKATVEKEVGTARDSLAKAQQAAAAAITPADRYSAFIGAKWAATRFLSSERDDPQVEFAAQSSGRRSALAAWITDRRNPLTARVTVNHIWARHMGTPLVATVFDFGRKGAPPTHPALLDWLAAELIDSGWDMKHLHRLIVTSSAYRVSSSVAGCDANVAMDPDNRYLWRRAPLRLEAQAVRDSILALAGTLDLARGGPPVMPADQENSIRRSLYFFHSNNDRNLFLTTFDDATVKECYRRDESIVPQQALALSNSRVVLDAAWQIAQRLCQGQETTPVPEGDREFVERAFLTVLAMRASEAEIQASLKALEAWRGLPLSEDDTAVDRARVHFVWALVNHNDFVTVR